MNALVLLAEAPTALLGALSIVLAVAGLIGIAIAILGALLPLSITYGPLQIKAPGTALAIWRTIVSGLLGFVFLFLGIILAVAPERVTSIISPSPPPPYAIISPTGSIPIPLSRIRVFHGTAPTTDEQLWLLVQTETGGKNEYYPQSDAERWAPIEVSSSGQWDQFAFLGLQGDPKGTEYTLHLALVDKGIDHQTPIDKYFKDGRDAQYHYTPIYAPLQPQGIRLVGDAATVTSA